MNFAESIIWHKYPEEKPPKKGCVLITGKEVAMNSLGFWDGEKFDENSEEIILGQNGYFVTTALLDAEVEYWTYFPRGINF